MPRSWLPLLVALGCAGSPARQGAPPARRLTIVGINDAHGALLPTPPPKWAAAGTRNEIGGADWFAGYLDAIRADSREKGGGVLLLDAGDAFQGTMIFDLYPFDNEQVVVSLSAAAVRDALEGVLRVGKAPMRVSGLRYVIDWEKFGAGADPRSAPAGAIVVRMVDGLSGAVLCETRSCTVKACAASCAPGTYPVSLPDFLADGGDGLTMLTDAPRRSGGVSTRDQIVAYVKEHRPLTAELLGAASSGKEPRWTQIGSSRRKQAGD